MSLGRANVTVRKPQAAQPIYALGEGKINSKELRGYPILPYGMTNRTEIQRIIVKPISVDVFVRWRVFQRINKP